MDDRINCIAEEHGWDSARLRSKMLECVGNGLRLRIPVCDDRGFGFVDFSVEEMHLLLAGPRVN